MHLIQGSKSEEESLFDKKFRRLADEYERLVYGDLPDPAQSLRDFFWPFALCVICAVAIGLLCLVVLVLASFV